MTDLTTTGAPETNRQRIIKLAAQRVRPSEIARLVQLSEPRVYQILAEERRKANPEPAAPPPPTQAPRTIARTGMSRHRWTNPFPTIEAADGTTIDMLEGAADKCNQTVQEFITEAIRMRMRKVFAEHPDMVRMEMTRDGKRITVTGAVEVSRTLGAMLTLNKIGMFDLPGDKNAD